MVVIYYEATVSNGVCVLPTMENAAFMNLNGLRSYLNEICSTGCTIVFVNSE